MKPVPQGMLGLYVQVSLIRLSRLFSPLDFHLHALGRKLPILICMPKCPAPRSCRCEFHSLLLHIKWSFFLGLQGPEMGAVPSGYCFLKYRVSSVVSFCLVGRHLTMQHAARLADVFFCIRALILFLLEYGPRRNTSLQKAVLVEARVCLGVREYLSGHK